MKEVDPNKKLPDSDVEWEYPYNQCTQTLGGHEISWNSTPNNASATCFHPPGTYTEINANGQKTELVSDKTYTYGTQGVSFTTEASYDSLSSAERKNIGDGGSHSENGGSESKAGFGSSATLVKNMGVSYCDEQYDISSGNCFRQNNDANDHNNTIGDNVSFIKGTKYQHVTEGEYGLRVADGNVDIQSDSGKTRIKSGDEIIIDSDTKITLVVGSSSIVIETGKITIKSPQVEFERA